MNAKPTEGPWMVSSSILVVDKDARIIAITKPLDMPEEMSIPIMEAVANAEHIAKAVNKYEPMKQAIQFALQILKSKDVDDAEAMPEVISNLEEALDEQA